MGWPHAGLFIWHDLMTTDVAKAQAFYSSVFGWKVKDEDMGPAGMYKMIQNAGKGLGGISTLEPSSGIPPHWMSYVLVDDVTANTREAQRLGGKVVHPVTEIPGIGWFAVLRDPQGGHLATFQPAPMDEAPDEDLPEGAGTFCWHELLAQDPERAARFYTGLFGWTHTQEEMGEMGTYHLFHRGEQYAGGMMKNPDPQGPSAWLPYIFVNDLEGTVGHTIERGGKIRVPPTAIPDVGRFSVATDPTGAFFGEFAA